MMANKWKKREAMSLIARVTMLTTKTRDGYSYPAYGEAEWRRAIRLLIDRGLNDEEIVAIMLSKWTRWAADGSDQMYGKARGDDLIRFMNDPINRCDAKAIADLVAGS